MIMDQLCDYTDSLSSARCVGIEIHIGGFMFFVALFPVSFPQLLTAVSAEKNATGFLSSSVAFLSFQAISCGLKQ